MRRLIRVAVLLLALASYLEFAWPPFYDFPGEQPFRGEHWYQPYSGYRGGGLLANFHAHANAWGGLTFGEVSREELFELYSARGYDLVGISDYMSIAPKPPGAALYLPTYEHGYTIGRRHQTVIGASRVHWFDYPLGGGARHKQHVIDVLRPGAELLVLNHLGKAGSYVPADLARLTGYDAIEVASKYGISTGFWDAALSAGRPIWGMASDDGHTQRSRPSHIGIGAVRIDADERTPEAALRALRAGRFHSIYMRKNQAPIELLRCELDGGELVVKVGEIADAIRFVSAYGALRHEARGTDAARYRPDASDPYLRVEVHARGALLFTNPLLRWDGVALAEVRARARPLPTWTVRALGALALALLARVTARRIRAGSGTARSRSRGPGSPAAPEPGSARGSDRS